MTTPAETAATALARTPLAKTALLRVVEVADAAAWDRLLNEAAMAHLVQGFAYGQAKAAKGWRVRRVVLADGDRPVALCQVLERRFAGLRLVTRINRGPLLLDPAPTRQLMLAVYRTVRAHWGRWWGGPLSIAPGLPNTSDNHALLREAGFRLRRDTGWWSARIDLERTADDIRAGLAPAFRNRLRVAQRSPVALRIATDHDAIEWMIERHVENMEHKSFNAVDAPFLRALAQAAPGNVVIFQALIDGKPVAGMSVVRFGRVAEYHVGWFGPEARAVNAGNFLMWSILEEMKRRGCTQFDVGGLYPGHGYTQFKRGMRGSEYRLAGEWVAF